MQIQAVFHHNERCTRLGVGIAALSESYLVVSHDGAIKELVDIRRFRPVNALLQAILSETIIALHRLDGHRAILLVGTTPALAETLNIHAVEECIVPCGSARIGAITSLLAP